MHLHTEHLKHIIILLELQEAQLLVWFICIAGSYLDSIYKFDVNTEDWILQKGELKEARYFTSAMLVSASQFPSCDP
jgi:hypothetical protein